MKRYTRAFLTVALVLGLSLPAFGDTFITSRIDQPDFEFRIGLGMVEGWSNIRKFANRDNIDDADGFVDIWNYPGADQYTYSTTADIDRLVSSDVDDTQQVILFGLDENWLEVSQILTLTGQTPVEIPISYIRSYRMFNADSFDFEGEIYAYVDSTVVAGVPSDPTKVRMYIDNGDNQTLMSQYTIPADKTGAFVNLSAAISKEVATTNAIVIGKARPFGGVFTTKTKFSINTTGTSQYVAFQRIPIRFPPKTDMVFRTDVSANGTGVSVVYSMVFVENTILGAP